MKRIKKYGTLLAAFVFSIYDKCFADVVEGDPFTGMCTHNGCEEGLLSKLKYVGLFWLIIVIIICIVLIIKKKKKNNK